MVTIWSIKKNTLSEDDLLQVELRGLSTETKPTSLIGGIIDNGSVFIEIDTQDVYIYDGENKEWVIPTPEESQEDNEEPQEIQEDNEENLNNQDENTRKNENEFFEDLQDFEITEEDEMNSNR